MMKKVVMLMLVLGMVSMASATMVTMVSWRVDGLDATTVEVAVGESVVLQIYSSADDATLAPTYTFTGTAGIIPGVSRDYAKITGIVTEDSGNFTTLTSATHESANTSVVLADYLYNLDNSGPTAQALIAGTCFTATLFGVAEGVGTANLRIGNSDGGIDVVDTIAFTVVPEPATMALLGLGALLLRRKK